MVSKESKGHRLKALIEAMINDTAFEHCCEMSSNASLRYRHNEMTDCNIRLSLGGTTVKIPRPNVSFWTHWDVFILFCLINFYLIKGAVEND